MKLFVAILSSEDAPVERVEKAMESRWGPLDFQGPNHPFVATDYYGDEMGQELHRRLVSFEKPIAPEGIVEIKLEANAVEADFSDAAGRRRVNLDVGYIDRNKVVLASAKFAGQKIHLGRGIYADFVLRYRDGSYEPFEWTFPDFRGGRYNADLLEIRALYRQAMRAKRGNP